MHTVLVSASDDVPVSHDPGYCNDQKRSSSECLRLASRPHRSGYINIPLSIAKDGLAGGTGADVWHHPVYNDPHQLVWLYDDSVARFDRLFTDFYSACLPLAECTEGVKATERRITSSGIDLTKDVHVERREGENAMKKLAIFGGIIILLFAGLFFLNEMGSKQNIADNPYGKSRLHNATVNQLDDPNYQNQILPDELESRLDNGEDLVVYFYSPECEYCREATPIVMETSQEQNVEVFLFNLLEFEEGWNEYDIQATPTLVYFKNGEEENGIVGLAEKEDYERFFGLIE